MNEREVWGLPYGPDRDDREEGRELAGWAGMEMEEAARPDWVWT